jgi:membrane fusion protein (multidrug efflux system)
MAEDEMSAGNVRGADASGKAPKGSGSKRKRIIIPAVIILVVAAAVGAYWYVYLRGYISTDDAFVDGDPVTVSSKILGRIASLEAAEGDAVSGGQLVASLDDATLKAEEAGAQANLALAESSVPVAKIALDLAREDFERMQIQYRDKIVTPEQYDHARQALEMAKAQYAVARNHVDVARAQLGVVETQLAGTRIVSPTPGVVAKKWVMPGDIVQPGQAIFTIYHLKNIWVTANLEETKLASISLGDSVEISVDAYPGDRFSGKVLLIGAAAASEFSLIPPNNASGNFTKVTQRVPVRISIDRPDTGPGSEAMLLPGMSVVVKVRTGAR